MLSVLVVAQVVSVSGPIQVWKISFHRMRWHNGGEFDPVSDWCYRIDRSFHVVHQSTDRHGLSVRNRRFTGENNGQVLQTLLEYIIAVSTLKVHSHGTFFFRL